jgi:hypothetical protein
MQAMEVGEDARVLSLALQSPPSLLSLRAGRVQATRTGFITNIGCLCVLYVLVLPTRHASQLDEFKIRSHVMSPAELLQAATCNCAELFCMKVCRFCFFWGGGPFV